MPRPILRRAHRSAARIVKVRMVQRIEHLSAELQLKSLRDIKLLHDAQVEVFITWRGENVAARAV